MRYGQGARRRLGHAGHRCDGPPVGRADATCPDEALLGNGQTITVDVERVATEAVETGEEATVRLALEVSNCVCVCVKEKKEMIGLIELGEREEEGVKVVVEVTVKESDNVNNVNMM